jgi:hypothetical protein
LQHIDNNSLGATATRSPRAVQLTGLREGENNQLELDCRHHMAEEAPAELAAALASFFALPT